MAKYSEGNIVNSRAQILCFASSTVMRPVDIHGDSESDTLPMGSVSAFASTLYAYDKKLPTILAGQFVRAKLVVERSHVFPLIRVQLEDGRFVSPFIIRRHHLDPVDNKLTIQSTSALFRFILVQALHNRINTIAIERPYDADQIYDKIVAMLPESVTIHKEDRV